MASEGRTSVIPRAGLVLRLSLPNGRGQHHWCAVRRSTRSVPLPARGPRSSVPHPHCVLLWGGWGLRSPSGSVTRIRSWGRSACGSGPSANPEAHPLLDGICVTFSSAVANVDRTVESQREQPALNFNRGAPTSPFKPAWHPQAQSLAAQADALWAFHAQVVSGRTYGKLSR